MKASWPKFCNITFLFLLKIGSVGPVDQQITLVRPKSSSRSQNMWIFFLNFRSYRKNDLIRKISLIFRFRTSQTGQQTIITQILPKILYFSTIFEKKIFSQNSQNFYYWVIHVKVSPYKVHDCLVNIRWVSVSTYHYLRYMNISPILLLQILYILPKSFL